MDKAWASIDAGKEFHWAQVLNASGRELLSRKVENDEADIFMLIDEALSLAEEIAWAVDQPGGGVALLLALLWERTYDRNTTNVTLRGQPNTITVDVFLSHSKAAYFYDQQP